MFCVVCGQKIEDGARFCGGCGWKVASGRAVDGNEPGKPQQEVEDLDDEEEEDEPDWDEEVMSLDFKDGGRLVLTRRKITGNVLIETKKPDGSSVKSNRQLDASLSLVTSTEVLTEGVSDKVGTVFVGFLIATGIAFWLEISPWNWCLAGLSVILFLCLFIKSYAFRIAIAGSEMDIPFTSGNKEDVLTFVEAVHTAKAEYERYHS